MRAILGKPWDDSLLDPEPPRLVVYSRSHPKLVQEELEERWPKSKYAEFWVGNDFAIMVAFDANDQVKSSLLLFEPVSPSAPPRLSLPARVWRRLRARYGW